MESTVQHDNDRPESANPASARPARGAQRSSSRALLGDANELIIEHGGREYRLRVTQSGKLILTA